MNKPSPTTREVGAFEPSLLELKGGAKVLDSAYITTRYPGSIAGNLTPSPEDPGTPARLRRHPVRVVCPRGFPRGERHRPDHRRGLSRAVPQAGGSHPRPHRSPGRTDLLHRGGVRRAGPEQKPVHPGGTGRRYKGVSDHVICIRHDSAFAGTKIPSVRGDLSAESPCPSGRKSTRSPGKIELSGHDGEQPIANLLLRLTRVRMAVIAERQLGVPGHLHNKLCSYHL
jgi:hypothetical protein